MLLASISPRPDWQTRCFGTGICNSVGEKGFDLSQTSGEQVAGVGFGSSIACNLMSG